MNKLILIVEDSPTHRHIAEKLCVNNGFNVLSTDDGEKALKIASEKHPDLILLDVVLPNQNGFQICRQLKKDQATQDIKIVIVTSKSQSSDKFWGMRQGADEYITKPYAEEELLNIIKNLISSHKTRATSV